MGIAFMFNPASLSNIMTKIADTTLGVAAASISFQSIATGYKRFMVNYQMIPTDNSVRLYARFNNDSGSNYNNTELFTSGSVAQSVNNGETSMRVLMESVPTDLLTGFMMIENSASTHKGINAHGGITGASQEIRNSSWLSNTEINRIDLYSSSSTLAAGSRAILLGW